MIYYGSRARSMRTEDALAGVVHALENALPPMMPIERHAGLIEALILAGNAAQGIADATFVELGHDDASEAERAVMAVVCRLAAMAGRSWEDLTGGGLTRSLLPEVVQSISGLRNLAFPQRIDVREPEGYAYYAVYPETYWAAAKRLRGRGIVQVVGIRSIGSSLSAMVAASLGADLPLTVRPVGHPFARQIRPGPRLDAALCSNAPDCWAIVDEGPGLSGSSFGAVADALQERGTPADKLELFPSHCNGPGPKASPRHQELWARPSRHVVDFDQFQSDPVETAHRLEDWVCDITGAPLGPMLDLAGGRWRQMRFGAETEWPPCDAHNERRKFLLHAERGTFLLRFAGIGASGRRTLARAEALAGASFGLQPLGLRHGFLVERWREDLQPLHVPTLDRRAFVQHLGAYLAFRARTLPAEPHSGASVEALFEMMIHNAGEAAGGAPVWLARWGAYLPQLARRVSRVQTDNRLHVWEWLTSADGRWTKTDGLDHCAGHDLIGCQDIAWDAAGAVVEFELNRKEQATLLARLDDGTGRPVSRELFRFCKVAYAAFQLGAFSLARARSSGDDAHQLGRAADRYAGLLGRKPRGVFGYSE